MAEPWKAGIGRDQREDGTIRHSQIASTYGPGALVDLVESAGIIADLPYWARGAAVEEDQRPAGRLSGPGEAGPHPASTL